NGLRVAALVPDDLEQILGDLAGNGPFLDEVNDRAELGGRNRRFLDGLAGLVQRAQQVVDDPIGREFSVPPLGYLLEIIRNRLFRNQHRGIICGQAKLLDKSCTLFIRQFRQIPGERIHISLVKFQGQKVRIGEVAVVVRLFLGTHRTRLALAGIEQARLLFDHAAVLQYGDLPACLGLDGLADEAYGIDVLDLAAGAEGLAGPANRDVDVRPQGTLVHVPVTSAEIAQDGAQLGQIGLGLIGRAHVGLGNYLHQRHARPVEVHIGHGRMLVMHGLARILFQMQAFYADLDVLVLALAVRPDRDDDRAFADDGLLELRDLVALGQVRIEIVLPVEYGFQIDPGLEPQPGADRLADALLVDDRQRARHGRVDQGHIGIGRSAEGCRGSRKEFCLRGDLRMNLPADNDLPVAGSTGYQAFGIRRAGVNDTH